MIVRDMERKTNTEIGSSRRRSGTQLGISKQCRSDRPVAGRHTHRHHPYHLCAIGRRLRFRRCEPSNLVKYAEYSVEHQDPRL